MGAELPHPASGEMVIHDPQISGHRLVVSKTRKICEVQRDRPLRFGPRKTFKVQTGDLLTATIEGSRTRAIAVLAKLLAALVLSPKKEQPKVTTLDSAWEEFKRRSDLRPRTLTLYGTNAAATPESSCQGAVHT